MDFVGIYGPKVFLSADKLLVAASMVFDVQLSNILLARFLNIVETTYFAFDGIFFCDPINLWMSWLLFYTISNKASLSLLYYICFFPSSVRSSIYDKVTAAFKSTLAYLDEDLIGPALIKKLSDCLLLSCIRMFSIDKLFLGLSSF